MHSHHAIVDLTPIAVVLPTNADRLPAALGRARLVHAADRLGMGVLVGHNLLAAVSEFFFIPLD
jgi:hypothetical protein